MRIAILVEGQTESVFKRHLQDFLKTRLAGNMPKLDFVPYNGRISKGAKLKRDVQRLLNDGKNPADAVIALTDVYTGTQPQDFESADDAKRKMSHWVGEEARFHPHVALHDFEAWLLPYWKKILELTGRNRKPPGSDPEKVNHENPPAHRLAELYFGSRAKSYKKRIDAGRILRGEDLMVAIMAGPELKAFVNRILTLCGTEEEDLIE